MNLTVTPTPSECSARDALPDLDPSAGVLIASTTMARRAWSLSQDLLRGLGARQDITGAGRRHEEDITLLTCWLHAYDIRSIVLLNTHHLADPRLLRFLLDLGRDAGCDIALTHDENTITPVVEWARSNGGSIDTTIAPLIQRITAAARPEHHLPEESRDTFPKFLPDVDFYAFRGMCRDLLPAHEFAIVDALYVRTFHAVAAAPFTDDEDVSLRIRRMLSTATSDSEAVTIIRATQAALFKTGRHLYVWMPTLRVAMQRDQHRRLIPHEIRALRAYRTPWRSSAVVLHDAGMSTNAVADLTLADIDSSGTTSLAPEPLSDDSRAFIRAHRQFRICEGATSSDTFFTARANGLRAALRTAGREIVIPTVTAQSGFDETPDQTWRKALGVRTSNLT